MKHRFTAALERFSRAMLAPLTYLSAAGLLLAAGALLTSTALSGALPLLQWGPVRLMGRILYKCLSAVISNLSVLFCTGLAASLAKQEKHQAAFIALMSYFIYLTAGNVTLAELGLLAQPDGLTGLYGAGQTSVLGIQTVDTGVFGGVLLGLLTAHVYDRTCKKAHKGILGGVFSGERWSFTCMAALAAVLGFGACFVWPPVQKAIAALTGFLAASGNIGLFLYGFLERLLIPTGLHHLVYMPFQFSQLGGQLTVGSVTYTGAYVVMMTEYNLGLPFSDGIVWMYTGFTKTFGYFGIAAAFIFCARRGSRRKTAAQLLPLAFTASLASVTEPMDFLFCFSAPVLWLAHAAISGAFIVLLHLCHVTAFTSNLLGSLAMNLSAGVARTHYPVLYLLGLAQIAVYFVVFTALIKALDPAHAGPTPGGACPAGDGTAGRCRGGKAHRSPRRAGEHLHGGQLLYPPAGHGAGCGLCPGAGAEGAALQRGGAKRLQCADRFRHPCAAGPAGGGAAAGQGGLLTFGGWVTIIGKERLPAQSERIFCAAPILSFCPHLPSGVIQ